MARPQKKDPAIVVFEPIGSDAFWNSFLDAALKEEWRLIDLHMYNGAVPEGLRPAGAVLSSFPDSELAIQLRGLGCKCIRRGNLPHPLDAEMPAVITDTRTIGKMAADHFAERGFKHVGYVVNVPRDENDQKIEGFQEEATRLGMEMHVLQKPRKTRFQKAIRPWIEELPTPIGILAYSPYAAVSICQAAEDADLSVPEQVAVLSSNESLACRATVIPLSAVELDAETQGVQAANLLKRILDGQSVPQCTMIPPKRVVVRQSTDIMAVPDLIVAKAMRYVWEYFDWPLTVDDVALEVGVSRSTLERRFRKHLGRGVNAELLRKRLETCGELLRRTSLSLADVAKATGFRSRAYLHNAFVKAFGTTPGMYRKTHTRGN